MKTLVKISSIFALLLVGAVGYWACEKQRILPPAVESSPCCDAQGNPLAKRDNLRIGGPGWIPSGSQIRYIDNHTVSIIPPLGWEYILKDEKGGVQIATVGGKGISVSCTCKEGSGGCSPFVKGSTHCCVMGNSCWTCKKDVAAIVSTPAGEVTLRVIEGGFIRRDIGVRFARRGEERLPLVFPAMMEVPEVRSAFEDFIAKSIPNGVIAEGIEKHDGVYAPEGFEFVLANIFGRVAGVLVPTDIVTTQMVSLGKWTCGCTQGTCTYKNIFGAHTCKAENCSGTCTLSDERIVGNAPEAFIF